MVGISDNLVYKIEWFDDKSMEPDGAAIFRGTFEEGLNNDVWMYGDKLKTSLTVPNWLSMSNSFLVLYVGKKKLEDFMEQKQHKYIERLSEERNLFNPLSEEQKEYVWKNIALPQIGKYDLKTIHQRVLPLFGYLPYEKRRN